MLFHFVQILYWLALATWFGGVLFVAVAAPIIFRTIRENDPIIPTVLAVNLEGQHGTLLAGSIVANLLEMLVRVELGCAAALVLAIPAQWFVGDREGAQLVAAVLRSALYVAAVGAVVYNWRILSPRLRRHRQEYIDHADEPEVANPAKDAFDRDHREGVNLLVMELFLLLGMVLFSAAITPAAHGLTWVAGR